MAREEAEEIIPGRHEGLARETRRLLGWYTPGKRMSYRDASRATGLSHTTIMGMAAGDRPSMERLIEFAQELDGDVNRLLSAAEFPPIDPPQWRQAMQEFSNATRGGVVSVHIEPPTPERAYALLLWEAHGVPPTNPFPPLSDRWYQYVIATDYPAALERGDELIGRIAGRYRSLWEDCLSYGRIEGQRAFLAGALPPANIDITDLVSQRGQMNRIATVGRQNALALIAWTEQRREEASETPAVAHLLDALTTPADRFGEHLAAIGGPYADRRRQTLAKWKAMLEAAGRHTPDDKLTADVLRLRNALDEDASAQIIGLMYLGLYVALYRELPADARSDRSESYGAVESAYIVTAALREWSSSFAG